MDLAARWAAGAERAGAKIEAAGVATLVVTPPPESNGLFRAYPRRDQASGRIIRAIAAAAARRALAAAPASSALLSA